tara:strand:- start:1376 stop:3406 length:2031 start_codon:yes stop_codon:yes gene_type:complete
METDYLQALGVGAGFDTKKIVSALVAAEKAGKQSSIDRRTGDVEAQVSGMAELKSSLQTLRSAFKKVDDQVDFNFSSLNNSAPTVVSANFASGSALPGTYKVSVSQLAQNDVYQSDSVTEVLEVDTYTLGAAVASSGSASFTFGGVTYTQAFDTDAAKTMNGLVAKINSGTAGSSVTAAATNSTVFTITKDAGSDTQMTKGTISGTSNGLASLSISAADTTAGIGAVTVDQNGTSAATVVIQVGSGTAETITLSAGSTSLTDLVTSINALNADVSARLVETSNGTYRVVVEGPQGSDNALTITDSVFGLQTTNVLERDTYTLGAAVSAGGSASFTFEGTTYTQAFTNDAVDTMSGLVAAINAGSAGSTVTAAATSGTVFTITKDSASDTQMTKGTIGGTSNSSEPLSISTVDTTNGSDGNKIQAAQDAIMNVNGLSVSNASNQVDGVVPGMKLNLMAVTSTDVVLSVSRDTSVAKAAIKDLVASYNSFESIAKGLTASGTATTEQGKLKSDASITSLRAKVRNFLTSDSSTPGTAKTAMSDIGVSINRSGTFIVDDTALSTALTNFYSDITKMFSANTNNMTSFGTANRGIAGDLVTQIDAYLAYDGLVRLREKSYSSKTSSLAKEQIALDAKIASVETRYTKQFSTMSKIMDEMKATQDYLDNSLGNLPFTSDND